MALHGNSARVTIGLEDRARPENVAGSLIEYVVTAGLNNRASRDAPFRTDGEVGYHDTPPPVPDRLGRIVIR